MTLSGGSSTVVLTNRTRGPDLNGVQCAYEPRTRRTISSAAARSASNRSRAVGPSFALSASVDTASPINALSAVAAKVCPLLLSVYAAIRPSGVTSNARATPATRASSMVRRIGGRALRHVLLPFPPRHGSKKRLGVLVSRHSKDVGCGTPFDDQPIFHDRDLLADVCGNPQIVCNEQH